MQAPTRAQERQAVRQIVARYGPLRAVGLVYPNGLPPASVLGVCVLIRWRATGWIWSDRPDNSGPGSEYPGPRARRVDR